MRSEDVKIVPRPELLRDVTQIASTPSETSSIEDLTRQVERTAAKADDQTLSAAMALRELRLRIEAGAAGEGVRWFAWARKNINIPEYRLYRLQAIAEADDPNAELDRIRKQDSERAKRYREKMKLERGASDAEREKLIRWAKSAQLEAVSIVLKLIREGAAKPRTSTERDSKTRPSNDNQGE